MGSTPNAPIDVPASTPNHPLSSTNAVSTPKSASAIQRVSESLHGLVGEINNCVRTVQSVNAIDPELKKLARSLSLKGQHLADGYGALRREHNDTNRKLELVKVNNARLKEQCDEDVEKVSRLESERDDAVKTGSRPQEEWDQVAEKYSKLEEERDQAVRANDELKEKNEDLVQNVRALLHSNEGFAKSNEELKNNNDDLRQTLDDS